MNSSDIILYKRKGFDGKKYINIQKEAISKRINSFNKWRLYLEVGGKFFYDTHAARVLPGYILESKKLIFEAFKDQAEILFCINANDVLHNRQLTNQDIDYKDQVQLLIKRIEIELGIKPHIVINNIDIQDSFDKILEFEQDFQRKNYRVWERYKITGYPHNTKTILSDDGFGNDDHIPLTKSLILATGAASNSGKLSTCLGQIYNDHQIGIESWYAKYETFPIWNLPLEHPVNLAYEAATADIEDYNMIDPYHQKAYNKESVNYNRDVEAFEVIMGIIEKIITKENPMSKYKSPTDMGINEAWFCITNDEIVSIASYNETKRRMAWYQEMIDRNEWEDKRVQSCIDLKQKCEEYAKSKNHELEQKID